MGQCKICGKKYHSCSSCGLEYWEHDYCCEEHYNVYRIEKLKEYAKINEMNEDTVLYYAGLTNSCGQDGDNGLKFDSKVDFREFTDLLSDLNLTGW